VPSLLIKYAATSLRNVRATTADEWLLVVGAEGGVMVIGTVILKKFRVGL
jgi:hypothetical protein